MKYKVTGTVPQPMYDPNKPYFQYNHKDDQPIKKKRPNGEAGRKISVIARSKTVALQMKSAFESKDRTGNPLFEDVTLEALPA